MRDELISLFIDDELNLDEKMDFVELVHGHPGFKDRTTAFLRMEKDLRCDPPVQVPEVQVPAAGRIFARIRPLHAAATAATAAIVLAVLLWPAPQEVSREPYPAPYRFVIYLPGATQAEITGDFTGWERRAMERIGSTGYWELSIPLVPGEHRFAYILDGRQRLADPTIMAREQDDFGGENSILVTGGGV